MMMTMKDWAKNTVALPHSYNHMHALVEEKKPTEL
jgi:hypothetical protein